MIDPAKSQSAFDAQYSISADLVEEPATHVRWRVQALLMVFAALCLFNRISISVAGTERIINQYAIDPTEMGMVYSAYLFVYTLCMVPGGWLIDRFGPKAALMLTAFGGALFVPATALSGMAQTGTMALAILFVIRGLLGMLSAPMFPGAARVVSFWIPYRGRAAANGMINGAAIVGVASTYFVFGYLMDLVGWPAAFVLSGIPTLLLALAWAFYVTDLPVEHTSTNSAERRLIAMHDPSAAPHGTLLGEDHMIVEAPPEFPTTAPIDTDEERPVSLLRNRSLMLLTASYAAVGYFQYLFFYWMQYYFDEVLEFGKDKSRLYATIPTLAMALGMAVGGFLADHAQAGFGARRGRALVILSSMFLSSLMLGLGALGREPLWVVTCFSLAMAAIGACEGPFWVTGIELGGRRGGVSASILNTGGNAGGIVAPVLTPLFSHYFGWQAGLGLACLFCLLGGVLWFWIDPCPSVKLPTRSP